MVFVFDVLGHKFADCLGTQRACDSVRVLPAKTSLQLNQTM